MTKTEEKKIRAEERRTARAAASALRKRAKEEAKEQKRRMQASFKKSQFMKRTLSIYRGQKARALKERGLTSLPYTIDEFRDLVLQQLEAGKCAYCDKKLTLSNLSEDHGVPISRGGEFTLENLRAAHQQCNFRKGLMTDSEFERFGELMATFPAEVVSDVWARLAMGGKWLSRRF